MQFDVRLYVTPHNERPVLAFLEDLRRTDPILHKLVVAGIKRLEQSERNGSHE